MSEPVTIVQTIFGVETLVSTIRANRTAKSYNASQYSHSTVFTYWRSEFKSENAPPLTTQYQPPDECLGRWMLIDNGADVVTTLVQTRTAVQLRDSLSTVTEPELSAVTRMTSSTPPALSVVTRSIANRHISSVEPTQTVTHKGPFRMVNRQDIEPRHILTAFRFTAWSIDSDPLFKSCQPFSDMPLYSPGVCPEGQEVVEITQILANKTDGGVHTSWQGSCCSSGMTFGPNVSRFCQSTITVPLAVHALITSSGNSSYEWVKTVDGSTSTMSSITGLATGLAVADPVVVAWNLEEMELFPDAYRTSLAQRIGVASPASGVGSPNTPAPTGNGRSSEPDKPASGELSTGAKAGIGVGVSLGTVLLLAALVSYLMRRSANKKEMSEGMAELEDPHTSNSWKRWFLGGRWRNEADVDGSAKHELDSRVVNVVSGPPAELDSTNIGHDVEIDDRRVTSI